MLGEEYHAYCDYCGSAEGTDWIRGEYKLYCSADCQRADSIPAWSCLLLVFSSMTVYAWSTFGLTYGVMPLITCGVFVLISLILIIRGIQAKARVDQRY